VRRLNDLGNIMNGDIQKIVDEPALVNMEKLKEASEVFK
jgi:peptide chain release factor 1